MTNNITLTHANHGTITIYSAKVERTSDNKITQVPIPEFNQSTTATDFPFDNQVGLINTRTFNKSFMITGYLCYNGTTDPMDELVVIESLEQDNSSVITLTWRGKTFSGYIQKLNVVDNYSGDFTTELNEDDIAMNIQFLFVQGVDFTDL